MKIARITLLVTLAGILGLAALCPAQVHAQVTGEADKCESGCNSAFPAVEDGGADATGGTDPLQGQRDLYLVDDLVFTAPRLGALANNGYMSWSPGVVMIPTSGGAPTSAFAQDTWSGDGTAGNGTFHAYTQTGAPYGVGYRGGDGSAPMVRSVTARPFATHFDHVIQLHASSGAKPVSVTNSQTGQPSTAIGFAAFQLSVYEYDATATPASMKVVSTVTQSLEGLTVQSDIWLAKLDLIVHDFNGDGFDDVMFAFGSTAGSKGPSGPWQWYFYTAADVNDPTQGLKLVGGAPKSGPNSRNYSTAFHAKGDLNGDGIIDIAKPVGCTQTNHPGVGSAECKIQFMSICPESPPANSVCDGKSAFDIVEPSGAIDLTQVPGFNQALCVPNDDATCMMAMTIGNYSPPPSNPVADELFLTLYNHGNKTLLPVFFDVMWTPANNTISATQIFKEAKITTSFSGEVPFSLHAVSAKFDWFGSRDQIIVAFTNGNLMEFHLFWVDTDSSLGQNHAFILSSPTSALVGLGLAVGNFNKAVPTTPCDASQTPEECDAPWNLQAALISGTSRVDNVGVNDNVYIQVVGLETSCGSLTYCLAAQGSIMVGPTYVFDITDGTENSPNQNSFFPQSGNFLMAGDLQGRGVRVGEPLIVTNTQTKPTTIIAKPPFHVDELPIVGFDNTLFPTSGSKAPAWYSEGCEAGKGCDCSTATWPVDSSTTCTMNWTFNVESSVSGNPAAFFTEYSAATGSQVSSMSGSTTSHTLSGSETTTITEQVSAGFEGGIYEKGSYSNTAGRTNQCTTSCINSSYQTTTWTTTSATSDADLLDYTTGLFTTYRYPLIGITCNPDGGDPGPPTQPKCTTSTSGVQYYTMVIPNQPLAYSGVPGNTIEWYQPIWENGNILSYPSSCSEFQATLGGLEVNGGIDANGQAQPPRKSNITPVSSGENSVSVQWQTGKTSESTTSNKYNTYETGTVSLTVGVGDLTETTTTGAQVTASGTFTKSNDWSTTSSQVNTTTGSQGFQANWPSQMMWQAGDDFGYLMQLFFYSTTPTVAQQNNYTIFEDPTENSSSDFVFNGFLGTMYTVGFSDAGGVGVWWQNEQQPYRQFVDLALNHPTRVAAFAGGGAETGGAGSNPPACINNGSNTWDCVQWKSQTGEFTNLFGTDGDWLNMRGFFVSQAPDAGATKTNGMFPIEGGQLDSFVAGTTSAPQSLLLQTRVYNYSLMSMAQAGVDKVLVQIYGQQWKDGPVGNSFLVDTTTAPPAGYPQGTIALAPIDAFPDNQGAGCAATPEYNWTVVNTLWDTTGRGGAPGGQGLDYMFWVLVWAVDENGKIVGELPKHGVTATSSDDDAPDEVCPDNKCTWMDQVPTEAYSNNLGFYRKLITIYPPGGPSASTLWGEEQELEIESFRAIGHQRRGRPITLEARLTTGNDVPVDGVSVHFATKDPRLHRDGFFDGEVISVVRPGVPTPVKVPYFAKQCGPHRLYLEASYATKRAFASVDVDFVCIDNDRSAISVTKQANPLLREDSESRVELTFEFEDVNIDLSNVELLIEDALVSTTAGELIRTQSGAPLAPLALQGEKTKSYAAEQIQLHGEHDGSHVVATLRQRGTKLEAHLVIEEAKIRAGTFCRRNNGSADVLQTTFLLSDGVDEPILLQGIGDWRCTDTNVHPKF